jgi:hypothetical protein
MIAAVAALLCGALLRPQSADTPPPAPPAPATPATDDCCRRERPVVDPSQLPQDRKSVLLRELSKKIEASEAPGVGEGTLRKLEELAKAVGPNDPPERVYGIYLTLGRERLGFGDIEGARAAYEKAEQIAAQADKQHSRAVAMRRVALCWMRLGERTNCQAHHNQDSCIFPLQGGAIHADPTGSGKAVAILEELLTKVDPDDVDAIWLLNVAHMTLGDYPAAVPERFRIPPERFASEHPMPRMFDVAAKKGIHAVGLSGGSCLDDFDGDGRLDVVLSSCDPGDPLRMFRQRADGSFAEVSHEVGLDGQLGGLNFAHFDANNDGRLDLLVQRGAWGFSFGRVPNSLLIQQEDGRFVDRTREAGIEIAAPSQVAVTADIDNDGDLDLFLGYEKQRSPGNDFPCRLFRNRGDGTFEDVTAAAGVSNDRFCKGAAFGDYDGDGFPDLFVSNMVGPCRLYHNNRDGTFTDVAHREGVQHPQGGFACWFFDYNNDGALDIYCACFGFGFTEGRFDRAAVYCDFVRNGKVPAETQRLYENDGKGHFRDVTAERGLQRVAFAMGSNFGDVDGDGFPDIYLGTGDPDFESLWPNVMYRNDAGRGFQDVTSASGAGHLQKGHGVSFGDIDGDGDQDLLEELGGSYRDDTFATALFENPGFGHRFLTVRILGHRTNRFGVGVRLKATIDEPAGRRDVYAFVGTNSSFGGNSLQEEMGLGAATRLVSLEVLWPVTGKVDRFTDVPLDRVIVVEEGVGWRLAPPPAPAPKGR